MKHLIIAHYEKDLAWTGQVPQAWKIHIVHNGVDRPNEGREPGAFLWWIANNYDIIDNDDELVFVQDHPFDHYIDLISRLQRGVYGFELLGGEYTSEADGRPHHMGLPVAECYERWLLKDWPGSIRFAPGGQFAVRGKRIKRYKKKFYELMEIEAGINDHCYVFERLWLSIFG